MNRIHLIILSLLIIVLSILEIIVFDEEVLLAFCFISFIFFAYSYLNQTVTSIFEDRANKFETDLLVALQYKYDQKVILSTKLGLDSLISDKISSFELIEIDQFSSITSDTTRNFLQFYTNYAMSLFVDITTVTSKLVSKLQNAKLDSVFYPLIYSLYSTKKLNLK